MKRLIAKHSPDVNAHYELVENSARLRIISRDHMVDGSSNRSEWQVYEIFGNLKINLNVASEDVDNTILVDDDRYFCSLWSISFYFVHLIVLLVIV